LSRSFRLVVAIAAALALPSVATAATPFTSGSGTGPSVAVGSDGTGHVVWTTATDNDQVGYCRVSAGAQACNRTELLNFSTSTSADQAGRARVFTPAPNRVVIVAGCWDCPDGVQDRTYRWISTNNGTSFGAPVEIGYGIDTNGFGLWLDDLSVFVGASGGRAKAATSGGEGIQFASGGIFAYGPEIARVPGTTKLVAAVNDLDVVKYGVYDTPGADNIATINNVLNWPVLDGTLPAAEPDNSETALNSGPNGVYLTYEYFLANNTRVGLRRFDPPTNSFGGPSYIEGGNVIDDNSLDMPDSFQDASGRIHAVWRSLYDDGRLRYTVSNTAGGGFSAVGTLARSESFNQPEVAAGANGQGFATWTQGTAGAIRVVPLDPQAETVPPTTPTTPTTPPGISGAGVGDATLFPGQSTTFRFRSSRAGRGVLTFEKRFTGLKGKRKGRKACLPRTKKRLRALRKKADGPRAYRKLLRKRGCKGWKRVGQIRQRVNPGANSIFFNGRIAGRKLTKGQYRGRLVITDSFGLVSRTETIKFKVVAKKKPQRRRR
jgi:hypothetical protein